MPGINSRRRVEEDDSETMTSDEEQEDTTQRNDGSDRNDEALDIMVKKLIRLALACEYNRKPIRRTEIAEKVLGTAGRQFRKVFVQAQQELDAVFGMQLVELPSKDKVTITQKRAAKSSKTTATSWILISTLPAQYHDPAILPPSAIPDSEQDSKYTAVYTMIVAVILLNRGSLSDAKLERLLNRLGMEDRTPVEDKPEKLLKRLERDGYIVKIKEVIGINGEEEVNWVVGPRGKVEVGDDGTKGLVETVYGHPEGEDGVDLSNKISKSLGVSERIVEQADSNPRASRKRRQHDENGEDDDDDYD